MSTIRGSAGFTTDIWQRRAAEDVGALLVLGAHPHLEVADRQLDIAAVVAARLDHRCHVRPALPARSQGRSSCPRCRCPTPCRLSRSGTMGRRAHSAALAAPPPDRVRPPGGPGQRPREHARGLCAGGPARARRASRATCGSPGTARPCSTTTALVRQRPAEAPDRRPATGPTCPTTSPRSPSSTPRWAPTSSFSLDVKDPAAFDRTVEVARAAGGGALERLWLCHHRLGAGGGLAAGRAPRCAWSTPPSSGTCRRAPSSERPRWPRPGSTP